MQMLVLRLDYRSSSVIENLQKHIRPPTSKRPMKLPHIPLLAYQNTGPLQLKAAVEPLLQNSSPISFSASDIGFSKETGRFYLQVQMDAALFELYRTLHLAGNDFPAINSNQTSNWQPIIPLIDHIQAPFWGPLFARLALESAPFTGTTAAIECWSVINGRTTIEWSLFLDN